MTIQINEVTFGNIYQYSVVKSAIRLDFDSENNYTEKDIADKARHISRNFLYGGNSLVIALSDETMLHGLTINIIKL